MVANTEVYQDYQTFLDAAMAACSLPEHMRGSRAQEYGDRAVWRGTETWTEAQELAVNGWDAIVDRVAKATDTIKDDIKPKMINSFESFYDVSGAEVDINRYLIGEPENMMEMTPVRIAKPGRVITMVVNIGALSIVEAESIIERGIAICGLIECLELLQQGTEIWVESTAVNESGARFTCGVKVKAAEDKMDMGKVMFAIAHPSMLRRLVFARREAQEEKLRKALKAELGGTYGRSSDCVLPGNEIDATLVLPLMDGRDKIGGNPEAWIRNNLSEFGLLDD